MSREEFFGTVRSVLIITLAMMAGAYGLTTAMLVVTEFKDAAFHYVLATIFPVILTPVGAFPLLVMAHRLRAVKNDLEALLRLDPLTELPNRRAFFELAAKVFQRADAVTLMMIDIDHFKQVNDTYGHDTGDRVLRAVAKLIQRIVAATESAGVRFAARIGGEEFAVLVEGLAPEAADRLANELVTTINRSPVQGDGQLIAVTVSIGVAHRREGDTPSIVLRGADNACYRAKRLGRNQWRDADADAGQAAADVVQSAA
jgi:diguanylate cyclase (GGDEF)-like protein